MERNRETQRSDVSRRAAKTRRIGATRVEFMGANLSLHMIVTKSSEFLALSSCVLMHENTIQP
jgi:hypothetical protein